MESINKETLFPHTLMIYLLENYSAPNRGVLLNDFLSKSGIGKGDLMIVTKASELLTRLELKQYLFWSVSKINSKTQPLFQYKSELTTVMTPFELYKIYAELTLEGIDYALKLVREQKQFESVIDTNESVKITNSSFKILNEEIIPNNNILQRNIGYSTMGIAVLSLLAIAFSAYYSSKGVTSEDIRSLKSEIQDNRKLLDKMQQFQKGIDSSLQIMAKDSLNSK